MLRAQNVHNYVLWFVLGTSIVSVVLLRWFSGEGVTASDLVAVGIALMAVGGYAACAWWASRGAALPIGRDQAGDNAYSIGLLLTFASLGVALVKLVGLIGTEPSDAEAPAAVAQIAQLIPDFGVALASTIFGIAARLWLQQQRMSPAEASEQTRRELERAVVEFTRSLRVATGTISTSTTTVRLGVAKQLEQAMYSQVESFEEAQELVRDAATDMSRGLADLAQKLKDANAKVATEFVSLDDAKPSAALRDLGDQARAAGAAVSELREACIAASGQTEALSAQVDTLKQRLEAVAPRDSADRLTALLEDALAKTEGIADAIARTDPQVSAAEALLKTTVQEAKVIETVVGRAARTAGKVDIRLDSAESAAQGLERGLNRVTGWARVLEQGMKSASEKATTAVQKTETSARALDTQVAMVVQKLRTLDDDILMLQKEVGQVRPDVTKAARRLSDLLPDGEPGALRAAVAEAHDRLINLRAQTQGDAIADGMVRKLEERLQDFARKLTAGTAEAAVTESVVPPPHEVDGHAPARQRPHWRDRWGIPRR